MEVYEQGLEVLFGYIYQRKPIRLEKLSKEVIEYIKGFRPRLPANEFPEDYPSDDGYDGTSFTLYRGLCFETKNDYTSFMEKIKNGIYESTRISSWTLNDSVAERFAFGANFENANIPFYKGIIIKAEPVYLGQTFFASYEAHSEFEFDYEDRLKAIEHERQHSKQEDEIVLLPGSYPISIIFETRP